MAATRIALFWIIHGFARACLCQASAAELFGVGDFFDVVNGELTLQSGLVDDRGEVWSRKADLNKLEVLTNDVTYKMPVESCILEERQTRRGSGPDSRGHNTTHVFQDRHQVNSAFLVDTAY